MTRLLLCFLLGLLPLLPSPHCWAQGAPVTLASNEILLEGRVVVVDAAHGEVQIEATAFELPNGRRRDLMPSKTKVIKVSRTTRFFDERTKTDVALRDLKKGDIVRVVGHDAGSGLPLAARLLRWNSSQQSTIAAPSPRDPLLPQPQTWRGLDLSVVDAGFKSPPPNGGNIIDPKWTLTVRSHSLDRMRFVELQTPEYPLRFPQSSDEIKPDGTVERTFQFSSREIDPRWPSVKARFEMTAPNAPPDAQGSFLARIPAEIPIPASPNSTIEPHLTWAGPNGVKVELVRVEAKDTENHLKLEWKWTPREENSDALAYIDLISLKSGGKEIRGMRDDLLGKNDGNSHTIIEDFAMLPRGARLTGDIYLRVYVPSLHKKEFIHTVDFDLPVSQLVASKPLPYRMPLIQPVDNEIDDANFRWEGTPNGEGTLWVSPQGTEENRKKHLRLLLRGVSLTSPGEDEATQRFDWRFYETRGNIFWHSDGSPADPLETGWRIDRPNYGRKPKVRLSASVMPAQVFESEHHFSKIPLPRSGETKTLDEDTWSDDIASVRKIAWVPYGTPEYKALEQVTGGMGERGTLVIVCEVTRAWPQSTYWLGNLIFNIDGLPVGIGRKNSDRVNSTRKDVLSADHPLESAISFFVQPPNEGEEFLDMNFHLNEVVMNPLKTFVIDKIPFP